MKQAELNKWQRYFDARNEGLSVDQAARKGKISNATAYRFERADPTCAGLEAAFILGINEVDGQTVALPLSDEAKRARDDFAYFRKRYFGRESTPWQIRAVEEILILLETPEREFAVMNEPPGSGKSTLFTHDLICWLIARDRTIRIMIGSRTETQARIYVGRIRRSLERTIPLRANLEDVEAGIAFDAEATLASDYSAFKPVNRADKWKDDELVVRQIDGVALDDKEATVKAWGQDSGFLGGRYDFVIWDDLVDRKNTRLEQTRQAMRDWWDTEAESRLERGGLVLLQGQRIAANDLYRHNLDKRTLQGVPKYRHVVYKAHYTDLCDGQNHGTRPWPDGCLLDPNRLPWHDLETIQHNNPRAFAVMYQQEDGDSVGGLVDPCWIRGDIDEDGWPSPGCLDKERGLLDPPVHLRETGWSYVTVDPSPSEWWGIIWWLYDPDTNNRYIIDLHRNRLSPQDFLTRDNVTHEFSGLAHDMYLDGLKLGIPLQIIVVETNAAQKWLLQQPHVQAWMEYTGVRFVPHTTAVNKNDPKYGVESIGDLFRQGLVRIPWNGIAARRKMTYLVDETTRYPEYDTTDLVMSTWFSKLAIEKHYTPRKPPGYQMQRPRWLKNAQRGMVGV